MTPAEQRYAAALDALDRATARVDAVRAELDAAEQLHAAAERECRLAYASLPRATRVESSAAIHAAREVQP